MRSGRGRDDHEAHLEYYRLVLDSLLDSGDLRQVDYSYALSPKAVATLDAHEIQVERHRTIYAFKEEPSQSLSFFALLAAFQVLTTNSP
jgi:hypothetical protein